MRLSFYGGLLLATMAAEVTFAAEQQDDEYLDQTMSLTEAFNQAMAQTSSEVSLTDAYY